MKDLHSAQYRRSTHSAAVVKTCRLANLRQRDGEDKKTLDGSESSFLEEFCPDLMRCQKNICLYPREHPRVKTSLDDLSQIVRQRCQQTGKLVMIDATFLEELADCDDLDHAAETRIYASLSRLLKLHLIQEVNFHPEVSHRELYEFSCLLQEDFLKAPAARVEFDPCTWDSIQLTFYTPQDFPDGLPAGESLLERAAGFTRSNGLAKILKPLPHSVGVRVQEALTKPAFLRKVTGLRCKLRARQSAVADTQTNEEREDGRERVDLIAVTLRNVVAKFADGVESPSAESILATVDAFVRGVEQEIDPLCSELSKLAARSPEVDPAAPPRSYCSMSHPVTDPDVLEREEQIEHLEAMLRRTHYDGEALRESLRTDDHLLEYVHVVLQRLSEPTSQRAIRKNWSRVLASLTERTNEKGFMEGVAEGVARFAGETEFTDGEDLLCMLVEKMRSNDDVRHLFEESVVSAGGEPFALRTLERLIHRRPKKAVAILTRLERHEALTKFAESNLVALSKNSALMELWAREDPQRFLQHHILAEIFDREPIERLTATFGKFFMHTPAPESRRLLSLLTEDLPGVECILIAAIQHGSPDVRDCALEFLNRNPIPAVIGFFIQTVRLKNGQDSPNMSEVEAVLEALVRIDAPRVRAFIVDVETSRNGWLNHEYRKDIRKTLRRILTSRGTN